MIHTVRLFDLGLTQDHIPVIQTHPPPNDPMPQSAPPTQSRHRLSSAREQPVRRLSNTAKAERTRSNSTSTPQSSGPQTLESLTQELDRVNREITDLAAQLESEEDKNRSETVRLEGELDDLRAKKKEDEDSKAGTKAATKTLEEQKRSVDATKSKLDRMLRTLQDELAKLESDASARLQELAEKEQSLADLCDQTAVAEQKASLARTIGQEGLSEVQGEITALEECNRILAQKIASMRAHAETRDPEEERVRRKYIDEREDAEDLKIEKEWVKSEKSLKTRHEQVKMELDEVCLGCVVLTQANREYREALALLVQARELHTAAHPITPGGKHRNKKPRSRRTRQKALSLIGQPNCSSPNLASSDPLINSRPASLTLPTGSEMGMYYVSDYPDQAMVPYEYQTPSPWASTHSLGMHDAPLSTGPSLETRPNRLASGALLSPSVSEHFLPSNLFGGPEEDAIKTSPYIDQLLKTSPSISLPITTTRISTTFPSVTPAADSPVSEISTRSSFSSPNRSLHALPLQPDRFISESHSSPTIIMTPAPRYSDSLEQEEIEVASPAELNGIPLSEENTDEEAHPEANESTSPVKHWKIPSLSFNTSLPFIRKTLPPEKRLPMFGTLKGEKARSMPRTSASVLPIGFNRPRSGSGGSPGWLQNVRRSRAPSETGRQFDINFDPLESRRLLENAGVVHNHSALANPIDFGSSPRASFDSRSSISRPSTDTDMARIYGGYFRPASVYSEMGSSYGWISLPSSASAIQPTLSLHTSPSSIQLGSTNSLAKDTWGSPAPTNASRSSLDPKAPEFRSSLQLQQYMALEPVEVPDVSPKRGGGRFSSLSKRPTIRPGEGFLNNFTGLFRRETKPEDEDPGFDLARPKSQDTQVSGDPASTSIEDVSIEAPPEKEKKKKEKKKKEKAKGKSIFEWKSKPEVVEDAEMESSKSVESIKAETQESEEIPKKKKKRGKKGVKFEKEENSDSGPRSGATRTSQDTGSYYYQGRDGTLDEVPVRVLDYFR